MLTQKEDLGLLDATFDTPPTAVDLDSPAHRQVALTLAEQSVVLLANDGVLPLAEPRRIAVIGPNADDSRALFGLLFLRQPRARTPPGNAGGLRGPDRA